MTRVMICGGGTGGHIFPAIAIGKQFLADYPDTQLLYVGADGGMEVDLVTKAGFQIKTVNISGFYRQLNFKNIIRNASLPFKYIWSQIQAARYIQEFKPNVVIGVGGYASFPVLNRAIGRKGILTVIQEQNAYPGLVNRKLGNRCNLVCMGNADAAPFFSQTKAVYTGNPIRQETLQGNRAKGLEKYKFSPDKPVLLITGGSLGAGTLNSAIENKLNDLLAADIQILWQTGRYYYESVCHRVGEHPNLRLMPFIDDMANTYAAADLVVCRAGASTISELLALSKPAILVPSPNVTDDHQTKNALSLAKHDCAVLMKDSQAPFQLVPEIVSILTNPGRLAAMRKKLERMEKPDSAAEIVKQIMSFPIKP